MKKSLTVLVVSLLLISCDLFKTKNRLLIETDWDLVTKDVISSPSHIRYSKYSKPQLEDTLYLDFQDNAILNVIINGEKETYTWNWSKKNENIINIKGIGIFKGNYEVGDNISSDFLFLSKKMKISMMIWKCFHLFPKNR